MPIIANNKYYVLKASGKYYDIYNPFATFTFTINPTPADATVTLTAQGYTQVGNSITVMRGKTVSWSVSKTGYITQSGTQVVSSDETKAVELSTPTKTITGTTDNISGWISHVTINGVLAPRITGEQTFTWSIDVGETVTAEFDGTRAPSKGRIIASSNESCFPISSTNQWVGSVFTLTFTMPSEDITFTITENYD